MPSNFVLHTTSNKARRGTLVTRRGVIETPVFMPVATRSAIKGAVSFEELEETNAQICLANTYHLHLRPTSELIQRQGGIHHFMKWDKPVLTDSGGFQVFSIQNKKITEEGVYFNSHIDGTRFYLDAEKSIEIQHNIDSDIIMAFDECPPSKIPEHKYNLRPNQEETLDEWKIRQQKKNYYQVRSAVEKTTRWAQRSLDAHFAKYPQEIDPTTRPQIFGIVQGGCFPDLRQRSLKEITAMPFDGFAMGGLAVGEPPQEMYKVLDEIADDLPSDYPRYLMGVGTPIDLLEAVKRGIDMFDCVLPMRNARHGLVYTWEGPIKISQTQYKEDPTPISASCGCKVCAQGFSRSYLHHLFKVGEDLAKRYLTVHNLYFYQDLMTQVRFHIEAGDYDEWMAEVRISIEGKKD